MESISEITKFLRNEKERWGRTNDVKISLKDVKTGLRHKASNWITFQDGSGEIKIYEEGSIPYSEDLDLAGVGRDFLLGGTALLVPVVGPWIVGGIIGNRGGKIIGTAVFTEIAWRNTYIFVCNALKECVFAMEIHYSKGDSFIEQVCKEIEYAVQELEELSDDNDSEWECGDEEYSDQEDEYEDEE